MDNDFAMKADEKPIEIDRWERLFRALELLADAFQTIANVQSERLRKEFPDPRVPKPAEVGFLSDEKNKEYSDKADSDWWRDTEAALPPSRFQRKFEADSRTQKTPKKQ